MSSLEAPLVGVIHDTTSRGHFDVAVYVDGILLMRVGSVAADRLAPSPGEEGDAQPLGHTRAEILQLDPENEFIPRESIRRLVLRKRRVRRSVTVFSHSAVEPRRFVWTSARNDFEHVRDVLFRTFGRLLVTE